LKEAGETKAAVSLQQKVSTVAVQRRIEAFMVDGE
jgi:hypothetical protein